MVVWATSRNVFRLGHYFRPACREPPINAHLVTGYPHAASGRTMKIPLHRCITKVVIADGDQLEAGPNWLLSRRAVLCLYDDHLQCSDWNLAYSEIRKAILTSFKTPILRLSGHVLSIHCGEDTYHFGLNASEYWDLDLPFPVVRTSARLRLSLVSILARCAVAGGIAYLTWLLLFP